VEGVGGGIKGSFGCKDPEGIPALSQAEENLGRIYPGEPTVSGSVRLDPARRGTQPNPYQPAWIGMGEI
jgi:hypothetical protein